MIKFDAEHKIWSGVTQPSILNPEANVGQIILNMLDRTPNNVAQIDADTGVKVTCAELRKRVVRAALNMTKMGYKKGDMIAFASRNHENVSSILFGCFCIGTPANGLDPAFNKVDFAHMLNKTKPKLVFCDEDNLEIVKEAAESVDLHPKFAVFGPAKDDVMSVDDFLVEHPSEKMYL
jgi:long-subunit acyl-CoA synthetase (AMP-forming)